MKMETKGIRDYYKLEPQENGLIHSQHHIKSEIGNENINSYHSFGTFIPTQNEFQTNTAQGLSLGTKYSQQQQCENVCTNNIPTSSNVNESSSRNIDFAIDEKPNVMQLNNDNTERTVSPHCNKLKIEPQILKECCHTNIVPQGPEPPIAKTSHVPVTDVNCQSSTSNDIVNAIKVEAERQQVVTDGIENFDNNLLRKYEFVKTFMNKLYLEKYTDLEKKLYEHEENIRLKALARQESEKENEISKYDVLEKPDKEKKKTDDESNEILVIDSDSDSDESILEVPIPPKPKPPVINLQDSDAEIESGNSDDEDIIETQYNAQATVNQGASKTYSVHEGNKGLSWIDDTTDFINTIWNTEGEDMVLNCTTVQKGASSITQIKTMSKDAQVEKATPGSKINVQEKPHQCETQDISIVYKGTSNAQVQYSPQAFNQIENEAQRKRCHEAADEEVTIIPKKQCTETNNVMTPSAPETNISQIPSLRSNAPFSSGTLQTTADFDLKEIQSKMSKDPKMWAILDEDLMPSPRRQRFWNMKCGRCQREGHHQMNCSEPPKPQKCHMCGAEGHKDSHCPQKMCLTCGKKQGKFRATCEFCRTLYCNMCKAIGHKCTDCPDLWRRFHQTTQAMEVNVPENVGNVMKPPNLLLCCNCTKRGHEASTCREYRWSSHFPTPAHVSNYTDGPVYHPLASTVHTETIIPPPQQQIPIEIPQPSTSKQPTNSNGKQKENKKYDLLYACGSFQKRADKQEISDIISRNHTYHIAKLKNKEEKPTFFKALFKIIRFKVKIVAKQNGNLLLNLVASPQCANHIHQLTCHWLQLDDDDRKAGLFTNLPKEKKEMMMLLNSKLSKFGDIYKPEDMWADIKQLKNDLPKITDPKERSLKSKALSKLQCKLVRLYQTNPRVTNPVAKFISTIFELKNLPNSKISDPLYLKIMVLYNKICVPYTPPDVEKKIMEDQMNISKGNKSKDSYSNFIAELQKYQITRKGVIPNFNPTSTAPQEQHTNSTQGNSNVQSTAKKGSYSTFIAEIQKYNQTQKGNVANTKKVNTTAQGHHTNSAQGKSSIQSTTKKDKGGPVTRAKSKGKLAQTNPLPGPSGVPRPKEIVKHIRFEDSEDVVNARTALPQSGSNFGPSHKEQSANVLCTQLQTANIVQGTQHMAKTISSVPGTRSTMSSSVFNNVSAEAPHIDTRSNANNFNYECHNDHSKAQLCNTASTVGKGNNFDSIPSTSGIPTESAEQGNSQVCSTDTKSKKSKNKRTYEILKNDATRAIQTALGFGMPHMTRSALEVEKKLKENVLEPVHVTVLQKLIKFEEQHQKQVDSIVKPLKEPVQFK